MRVLVAPGRFAGTLTATEAAAAIAAGWRRRAAGDLVRALPMDDGGPGFVDVLHAGLGGDLEAVTVSGPLGARVPGAVLIVGRTAYVEAAQAAGTDLLPRDRTGSAPEAGIAGRASTTGVGELVAAALDMGVDHVVVGLGGVGATDGGAGLLAALGATATGGESALLRGALGLAGLESVDLVPARDRVRGVDLVAATDVDNPLLGLRGATNVHGPRRGLSPEAVLAVDGALSRLAHAADRGIADHKGAGAAGGLGYGLLLLGATARPGLHVVADALRLGEAVASSDLVVTGSGSVDVTAFGDTVVTGVARAANAGGVPCIALAGDVQVGSRELRNGGVEAAYGMADLLGHSAVESRPAETLAALAERVARTWSHA